MLFTAASPPVSLRSVPHIHNRFKSSVKAAKYSEEAPFGYEMGQKSITPLLMTVTNV